jgi:YidC/Oxa1 family membrane protein insertase
MDRQTTIAFVLIGVILMIWLYMSAPTPVKQESQGVDSTKVVNLQKDSLVKELKTEKIQTDTTTIVSLFKPANDEKIITVENDLVKLELSSRGANIRKYFVKKFNNWYSIKEEPGKDVEKNSVQLINYSKGDGFDLAFVTSDGKAVNTSSLGFESSLHNSFYKISSKDSLILSFTYTANDGSKIVKRFIFFGDKYSFNADVELSGMNSNISNNAYDLVWDSGIRFLEENSVDEATYSNSSAFYGDEQVIVDASDAGTRVEKDFSGRVNWVTVRNKYFAVIISPQKPESIEGAFIAGNRELISHNGVREFYSARLKVPFKNTALEKQSFTFYIGPVDYDILKTYGTKFEAIVDFGSFFGLKFIVRPIAEYVLLPLFNFLRAFIPNFGFVIIVFSVIIKIVLYPLTKSSMQSMKKMQLLQPMMAEIKEKFKDDPTKANKETMKLYSTYGVNPAGGCLPLLLQMPIFIALWGLFQVAIELRQQPFMFWISDLSRPDVIFSLPFKMPLFGVERISGLALLMGITTFFQQKMSIKDPKQQMLVYLMPVMLTLMFMSFPSGLNLYYFMFNVLSIAQQYYINHKHDGMVLEPVKNPKKKSGFMSRLMDAAEQNAKVQQKKRK